MIYLNNLGLSMHLNPEAIPHQTRRPWRVFSFKIFHQSIETCYIQTRRGCML